MEQINKIIALFFEFIVVFYLLQAVGPSLDSAVSDWTGIFAPFGEIVRFLAPSPDQALLAFIESLLITFGAAKKL